MIRLVIGLCLLFLGLGVATAMVVHAVRRKRAAAKLRRPFVTKKHAGAESTYWMSTLSPDTTKAVTKTSGRQDERPQWIELQFTRTADVAFDCSEVRAYMEQGAKPIEEWKPTHPLPGWQVVKAHGLWFAVPPTADGQVQRYSRVQMGWVAETHDNLRVAAVLAAIHETTGEA